jgi:hypothetical protein
MQIEQEKQRKAVDRFQRANIKSVEEAEKLAARYWNQFCEDKSEKNQRLMHWSRSVVLGKLPAVKLNAGAGMIMTNMNIRISSKQWVLMFEKSEKNPH